PQSRMRGLSEVLLNLNAPSTNMSCHCGHSVSRSAYARLYPSSTISPGVWRGTVSAIWQAWCHAASSRGGNSHCLSAAPARRARRSNGCRTSACRRDAWPRVHRVRRVEGPLERSIEPAVHDLRALREAVILIRHLVLPRAEAA